MSNMYKIIITGAGGFIGSSFIKRIINEDVHVWAIDRHFEKDVLPRSNKITELKEDTDKDELKELLNNIGFDAFYNFAWQGVNGSDKAEYDVQINNIMLTLQYAELAHTLGCKKYLCAGTIAERAVDSLFELESTTGGMMYSAAKTCAHTMLETYCKTVGLEFVWMQFANIYGPKNKTGNLVSYTITQLKKNKPASFGPALQPYDFLYIDDLIEAIYRLGRTEANDNFYYIGSGEPRILEEYLKTVGEIFGLPDLIHIGERPDDGIKYSYDMLDSSATISAIGNYVSDSFENHIKYTIEYF